MEKASSPMNTPKNILAKRLADFAANRRIAYGHQDDLCYGHTWKVEDWKADRLERSDVKAVTGKYPMVLGLELGRIEHSAEANLDHVPFDLIRKAVQTHIARGGIVTLSWHADNPLTGGNAWDVSSDQVVASILPGGKAHEEFLLWLRRAADFIESLGEVSVIFRPWHEHTGSWFWWGRKLCTPEQFQELFRMTWRYFTVERGLVNLLWCYSPNGPVTEEEYMERYPGDEFVDILGGDFYEGKVSKGLPQANLRYANSLRALLNTMTALGKKHGKLIALTETGLEGLPEPHWWTEILAPVIRDFPINHVLTWRNASNLPNHFYAPWDGFAHAADFQAFSRLDNIVFLDEAPPPQAPQH